jgi:NAD(P)-dependent dehydrogenase (short-subunit alcohol dehydrogenase family)
VRDERRIAIVAGGAGTIGRAVVQALARDGARVWVLDRARTAEAEKLAERSGGGFLEADVARFEDVERAFADFRKRCDRLDVLVNCAGIAKDARLGRMEPDDWRNVIDVNLTGSWNVLREAVGLFHESRGGRVVNVASVLALRGRAGVTNYAASKAGLLGLTRAASHDLAPLGVTVNAVAPGFVETPMTEGVPAAVKRELLERTPTGRWTTPEDVAEVIAFLCSDRARQINGEVIRVDGGLLS